MAGFRQRVPAVGNIAMVAHPSVTLLVDLSEGDGPVYDIHGRRQRGSVVVGLLPGDLRASGWARVECLQIRLEPAAAAAVLGATTELSRMVVSLEDVWGRDAGRAEERLRAAASWDERFTIAAEILVRRLGNRPVVDPEVAYAWRRTLTGRGRVRVDGLADEVGWSRKRLWSDSGPSSASRPNAPPGWCGSTTPLTFSRRVTPPPASRSRVATSTSPTSTARSRSSPGSRPRPWPSRRGSRSTTLRGRLHRQLGVAATDDRTRAIPATWTPVAQGGRCLSATGVHVARGPGELAQRKRAITLANASMLSSRAAK
jgi:hypothetical protein